MKGQVKGSVSQLGLLVLGLATASLPATAARAESGAPAQFELTFQQGQEKTRQFSLLQDSEAIPPVLHQVMLGEIAEQMKADLESFRSTLAEAEDGPVLAGGGYGDGDPLLVALCVILGFIPGFGIGHLVAGHIGGFILFLIVDLILGGFFFGVFPFVGFTLWYVPSTIVIFIERIVEAVLAGYAATRPGWVELTPVPSDEQKAAVQATVPLLSF